MIVTAHKKLIIGLLILAFILCVGIFLGVKYVEYSALISQQEAAAILPTNTSTGGINVIPPLSSTATTSKRTWHSNWNNGKTRTLTSGKRDPFDSQFIARGNGTVTIDGKGIAHMKGDSPRMYVYDEARQKKWNNVEVIVYAKRMSETGTKSSQGFVIGARSEHQDASLEKPCLGRTYYGRLLYDGRAVFQKEVIHEGAYSVNKPEENYSAHWNTPDGTLPVGKWIGLKYIVRTQPDGTSVKLELYRDLTDGKKGGTWEKLAEYIDKGDWSQTDTGVDVQAQCGYAASDVLLAPGTSVFIRNDEVKDVQYKNFSIREL
jgi:hypothetical protein